MIKFSSPGKIHLLGEHAVVYGKPALLTTVDLRITVTISPSAIPTKTGIQSNNSSKWIPAYAGMTEKIKRIIEPIVKKYLKLKTIPPYQLIIDSQLAIGSGLGSSAALSSAYIAALLTFLKVKWNSNLINDLTYEAEKTFHGNPSGGDNSTVVFGGLIWFRKEATDLKIIQQLPFSIPEKLAKNFVLINTGKPKETTKEIVELVRVKGQAERVKFKRVFDEQEQLVKELSVALKEKDENNLIRIIKTGEKNLEKIGVVSKQVASIIRRIERSGGTAKICGGGGIAGPTGMLLCYHQSSKVIKDIAKSYNLDYFKARLGVEGLRKEL